MSGDRCCNPELEHLAHVLESLDEAIISASPEGEIRTWNKGAERLYGWTRAEALECPLSLVVPEDRRAEFARWLQEARAGERVRWRETVRVAKGGAPLEVAETIVAVTDMAGGVVAMAVVDHDTSEQRWVSSTLDAALGRLEIALAEANAAEARGRQFLADAAHQLRTPLAAIRASTENLLREVDPGEQRELFSDLVRETDRASRLVSSLLRVAHLDEGHRVATVRCDVLGVCAVEADRTWSLAPHLDVVVTAEEPRVGEVDLDPHVLHEALANLLDNARRHAQSQVQITVSPTASGVELRVSDDGEGVPEGMEDRIFDRFVSADDGGGSGLGLAIARQLARAHGGDLRYERPQFVLSLDVPVVEMEPSVAAG